jgi:hypothetical protein
MEVIKFLTAKDRLSNLEKACNQLGVVLTISEQETDSGNIYVLFKSPSIPDILRANYLAGYFEGSDAAAERFSEVLKQH